MDNKIKKTRLIAKLVLIGGTLTTAVSLGLAIGSTKLNEIDIDSFIEKQNIAFEQAIENNQIDESFKSQFDKISKEYADGTIDYQTYETQRQSIEAKQLSKKSTNSSLTSLKNRSQSFIKEITDPEVNDTIYNASLASMCVGMASIIGSGVTVMYCDSKKDDEEITEIVK